MWKTWLAKIFGLPEIVYAPDTGTTSALSVGQPSATAKVTQQGSSAGGGIDRSPQRRHMRVGQPPTKTHEYSSATIDDVEGSLGFTAQEAA